MEREYKDRLLLSTNKLYQDIDKCISNLVEARMYKDGRDQEYLLQMESLMVASLQQFGCVIDFLQEQIKEEENSTVHVQGETAEETPIVRITSETAEEITFSIATTGKTAPVPEDKFIPNK